MSKPVITEDCFREARDDNEGWCKGCKDFTTSNVEPDAKHYECDKCGENTVIGAESALILQLFGITDETEEEGEME